VRTGSPGHLGTFDYTGRHRYFLTFCTHARREIFSSADDVGLVLGQFQDAAAEERMLITAYCFMPDHAHLLVEGGSESSDCLAFIRRAKQSSAYYYKRRFKQPLWQRYGFERVLRNDEETLCVARYIVENPLRAGLTTRAEDYPFVGSDVYTLREILEAIQMNDWSASRHR
jgi:putative transposase